MVAARSLAPGWVTPAAAAPARSLFASSANFKPYVGTPFKVKGMARKLVLESVTDFRAPGTNENGATGAGFTLQFGGATLQEGTYTLVHSTLGTFAIFLAPVGGSAVLEAVVNRLN